jgi:hypothetical protein
MWDAFQREVLGAMGHVLLVPVSSKVDENVAAPPAPRTVPGDVGARPALLHALALAAAIDGTGSDIGQYIALPPLDELRTPDAKRSLWPRLRALRKMRSA